MKIIFKKILQYYLKYITKLVLFIHRPEVVVISGSSNKTFIRDEIRKVLQNAGKTVRANPKNFNTEIGLPLAILNVRSGYNSYSAWVPIIFQALFSIFQKNFPDFLVLELGVSKKGDMKYLLSIVKPKIAIISEITQRYVESFSGMDNLVREYKYLAKKMPKKGWIILNHDNLRVRNLSRKTKAQFDYFGKTNYNQGWIIEKILEKENGQELMFKRKGESKKVIVDRFGDHHAYAFLAGEIFKSILLKEKK